MTCSIPSATITLTAPATAHGQRLDSWLASALPDRSRSEVQRWIKAGNVLVAGTVAKASQRLEAHQLVTVEAPPPSQTTELQPQEIPLSIIYEDGDLLVVDKPAGLVVHPAPGHAEGTLVNAILHHCPGIEGVGGERRPGIVHRLDKETSGLLVVAKNDRAHRLLQAQFKARTVYKEYQALIYGSITPPQGRIIAPIGRHPTDRKRQAVLPPDPVTGISPGRQAITDYYTLAHYQTQEQTRDRNTPTTARFTFVRLVLHTGRTHQIRVHLAWRKHPVVGDALYGSRQETTWLGLPSDRQFLHAHRLRFYLPGHNEEREFVAPLPAELQTVLEGLTRVGQ